MKKGLYIAGIITGILCIIFSFSAFSGSTYVPSANSINHSIYGGDAYTGIQNAAADTGNNVKTIGEGIGEEIKDMYDKLCQIGGFALLISGILISLKYSISLYDLMLEERNGATFISQEDEADTYEYDENNTENPKSEETCHDDSLNSVGQDFSHAEVLNNHLKMG